MAKLDALESADSASPNTSGSEASRTLSLEGNPAPPTASQSSDRGHSAHAAANYTHVHHNGPHIITPETPGIDVSEFNGSVDWSQVAQAGMKFAFIRATDGTTIQDADFQQNWKGAEAAGLQVGAYHYFTTTSSVQDQIANFTNTVAKVDAGNLPPVIDVEDPAQFANYTVTQRISMIQQMLDGVQQNTGEQPILYMSTDFSSQELGGTSQFDKYKLWVADYTTDNQPNLPPTYTNWNFWQHSDSGTVSGVTGTVDLDYFNGSASQLPTTQPVATQSSKAP
jgi:lysozyme